MAIVHSATVIAGKLELLTAWSPTSAGAMGQARTGSGQGRPARAGSTATWAALPVPPTRSWPARMTAPAAHATREGS